MNEKIEQLLKESLDNQNKLLLSKELIYKGGEIVQYAVEHNLLSELMILFTPQLYGDGSYRILLDPFSNGAYEKLQEYEKEGISGIKELIESLFIIDYENLFKIKIKHSHARQISGMGHPIRGEKDVIHYSEPACLQSMLKLYNLNIDTWANDTEGCYEDGNFQGHQDLKCGINIYYDRLSEENKKIIADLNAEGHIIMSSSDDIFLLYVNCNSEETIGDVNNRLISVISRLKIQDIPSYPLDEDNIRQLYILKYSMFLFYREIRYEIFKEALIEYYSRATLEEFKERDEIIAYIQQDNYDLDTLKHFFYQEPEYRDIVLAKYVKTIKLEDCIAELLEDGCYIDEENKRIYSSKRDYLRHLNYLNGKPSSSQEESNKLSN